MPIDPSRPVYLKRMVVDPKNGNTYPAFPNRPYSPGTLPVRFLTEEYCSQEPASSIPANTTEISVSLTPDLGNREATSTIKAQVEARKFEASTPPLVPPSVPQQPPAPEVTGPIVNINTVEAQALSDALDGVGAKTAAKVVSERESKPFVSLQDLSDRVPLSAGRKWESFESQIKFAEG